MTETRHWDQSQSLIHAVIGIDPPFTLLDAPWAIMAQMSEQLQPLLLLPRENRIFIDLSGLCKAKGVHGHGWWINWIYKTHHMPLDVFTIKTRWRSSESDSDRLSQVRATIESAPGPDLEIWDGAVIEMTWTWPVHDLDMVWTQTWQWTMMELKIKANQMELLQSQARTKRELSGIPADRSFGI